MNKFFAKIIFLILIYLSNIDFLYASYKNKIIVKIGNEIITEYEIKNKILGSLILTNEEINQENINRLKKQSLENLKIQKLKKIELSKYEIKTNPLELNSYLKQLTKDNLSNIHERFELNGLDFTLYKEEIELQIKWQKYIYNLYEKRINIKDEDIDNEVKILIKNKKDIIKYKLSEIEILIDDQPDNKKIIENLYSEIKIKGFANAAKKFSISNSAANNGELGWINEESLSKKIYEYVSKLKIGDVTEPIKRQNSILILKLVDKSKTKKYEINLENLKKNVLNQKKNELFNLYSNSHLSKLKNSTLIEYK